MGLPVEVNNLMLASLGGYTVGRSLRFRPSASAYLNRTPASAGNRRTFTWSGWLKYCVSSNYSVIFSALNGSTDQDALYLDQTNPTLIVRWDANAGIALQTAQVFRDPSAWYHIILAVDTTQATASNRMKLYVNGVQITAFTTANYPTLNQQANGWNTTNPHYHGVQAQSLVATNTLLNGYLAEVNFIDGQALTPSSFGAYDTNGVWQPKKYSGTYGTNGFYLPFSNTTSTTTLVQDSSGNGNNWTPNNISLTAGTTYDSMIDSPTVSASSSNYAVLNPLTIRGATGTLTNGNLSAAASSSSSPADTSMYATLALPSNGLIYLEALYTVTAGLGNDTRIGVSTVGDTGSYVQAGSTTGYWSYDYKNGTANAQGSNTSYTAASTGQTVMFAIDVANGKIWAGANGTWYNSGNPASGTGAVLTSVSTSAIYLQTTLNGWVNRCSLDFNFGQRPFTYTPPSGFKALNTYNLPAPSIANGAQYMAATTYTGTGSALSVSNAVNGVGFQPDFVWMKKRSAASSHYLQDSVRGSGVVFYSDQTAAENAIATGVTSFNSSGFSLGTNADVNGSGASQVAWNWKAGGTGVTNTAGSITSTVSANPSAGFSIVTYTGTGAAATVGHGLGVAPQMIIVKSRNTVIDWIVYHTATGNNAFTTLNTNAAQVTGASYMWNSTSPTSSVFSVNTDAGANGSGKTYVAYCFASVRNYSAIGSFIGNASADGPFIFTGFRPAFVLTKNVNNGVEPWMLQDTARSPYNLVDNYLRPNYSNAETSGAGHASLDYLSNGFKVRNSGATNNGSGNTIIYIAFAEHPFNYSRAR